METVTCNLCDSVAQRVVYSKPDERYFPEEWFTVVECNKCGLGFVNPRPTPVEMARYYPPAYYDYDDQEHGYQQHRYDIESGIIQSRISTGSGKQLLDIGCANGTFLRQMQRLGWEVEGVEVSSNSQTTSDFKIYREEFPHISINEPHYDAVTAWAVLEHVHDPMAHFRKVGTVLRPGGIFVFLVTNFDSLSSRALFREDVPRHLYFFTEKTIREYLSRSGLMFVSAEHNDDILSMRPVGWLRYYLYRLLGAELTRLDIPPNRTEYLAKKCLKSGLTSNLRYAGLHPFTVIDRLLLPVFEKLQMLSRTYGIVTYVAIKV